MNFAMIGYVLGWVFNFEAVFLLLPALVGLVYREPAGWGFLLTAGICLLCGVALVLHKPRSRTLYAKEGYVIVRRAVCCGAAFHSGSAEWAFWSLLWRFCRCPVQVI